MLLRHPVGWIKRPLTMCSGLRTRRPACNYVDPHSTNTVKNAPNHIKQNNNKAQTESPNRVYRTKFLPKILFKNLEDTVHLPVTLVN